MVDQDDGSSRESDALKAEILRKLVNHGHTNPTNIGVGGFADILGEDEDYVREAIDEMIEEGEPIELAGFGDTVHVTDAAKAKERANEIIAEIYDL